MCVRLKLEGTILQLNLNHKAKVFKPVRMELNCPAESANYSGRFLLFINFFPRKSKSFRPSLCSARALWVEKIKETESRDSCLPNVGDVEACCTLTQGAQSGNLYDET